MNLGIIKDGMLHPTSEYGKRVAIAIAKGVKFKRDESVKGVLTAAATSKRERMLINSGRTPQEFYDEFGITRDEWLDEQNWEGDQFYASDGSIYRYIFDSNSESYLVSVGMWKDNEGTDDLPKPFEAFLVGQFGQLGKNLWKYHKAQTTAAEALNDPEFLSSILEQVNFGSDAEKAALANDIYSHFVKTAETNHVAMAWDDYIESLMMKNYEAWNKSKSRTWAFDIDEPSSALKAAQKTVKEINKFMK